MHDLPGEVKDQLGPWGYVIAGAIVTFGGAAGSAAWWLAKKIHAGAGLLYDLLKNLADGHLEFLKETNRVQQAQAESLKKIEHDSSAIRAATEATSKKIGGWDSDLSIDSIRQAMTDALEQAVKDGVIRCKQEDIPLIVEEQMKHRSKGK